MSYKRAMAKKADSNKTELVTFRLAPAVKKAALAAAAADSRTLSGWLEKIVRDSLPTPLPTPKAEK